MSTAPSAPWTLSCPWCAFHLAVYGRGAHGADEGAGVEAADRMSQHVRAFHGRTWREFLSESEVSE